MKASKDVLVVLAVTDRPIAEGSLVEVLLFLPSKDHIPDLQAEYDLASLGEVESIHGPYCDPPRWMVTYKGKVLVKKGDRIKAKDSVSRTRSSLPDASSQPVKTAGLPH
jgi:hypothetical protein